MITRPPKEWPSKIGFLISKALKKASVNSAYFSVPQASCGSGVPFYEFKGQRGESELLPFYEKMGEEGVNSYWKKKNQVSIDGKPTHIFS